MPRLMSVAMTTDAVRDRTKTVTRRAGWKFLKPGDRLTLCAKVQGRKPGEPLVKLALVEVVSVRREHLGAITQEDVAREGFPGMDRLDFIQRFFIDAQDIHPGDDVTRVEWRYLDAVSAEAHAEIAEDVFRERTEDARSRYEENPQ